MNVAYVQQSFILRSLEVLHAFFESLSLGTTFPGERFSFKLQEKQLQAVFWAHHHLHPLPLRS